jgi:hypothetical protein
MPDSLVSQLEKSGYIDSATYKEETDLLIKFYLNIKEILNIPNKSLENSILSLNEEFGFQIDGKRYKHKDIKEVIDIVNPVLEGIINKTYTEQEGIELINQTIVLLKSMTKPDINPLLKAEVLDTGYINLTTEQLSEFQDWLMQPIEELPHFKSKFSEVSYKYEAIYLFSLKKLIDYKEEQDLLKKLNQTIKDYVDGGGLNLEKYSQCLYIGINVYDKIFQSTLPNGEIKKILNEGIITINSLPKNKINNDTKSAVIITNNPYIDNDNGITIMDLLEEPTEGENEQKKKSKKQRKKSKKRN